MSESQKQELTNQSVARLHQIKASLVEAGNQEQKAIRSLTGSAEDTPDRRLAVELSFLRTSAELYKELASIALHLLNLSGKMPALDDSEIVALAKDVGLASKLRQQRQQGAQDGNWSSRWCPGFCETCITSCTECIGPCLNGPGGNCDAIKVS
jgi:hypothetical protein